MVVVVCGLLLGSSGALAADDKHHELAKQEQNPLSRLVRIQLEDNAQFGFGPDDETLNFLRIQPVFPFDLSEDWSLVTRTVIPIAHVPFPEEKDGLSDIALQLLFSPERARKLVWGAGPSFLFPTATDDLLGTGKWSIGPAAALVYLHGPWVVGVTASQVWSIGGDDDRDDVDSLALRPLLNYNFPHGWYLTYAPLMIANWDLDRDNRWLVPLGGGVGKITELAGRYISVSFESFYHVVSPDIGPDWQLRLQLTFLYPK